MKQITLTKGQVAIVDDKDFERLNEFKWYAYWADKTQSHYAARSSPHVNGKQRTIRMHREILGAPTGAYVDHLNHDTLDNRRENLRVCSTSQNNANRQIQSNNTSGYKGVSWCKRNARWRAVLMIKGKLKHIGLFTTPLEAALAYDRAAVEIFGEFALTNQMLGLVP